VIPVRPARLIVLAPLLACLLAPAPAAARARRTVAPSCTVYQNLIGQLQLGGSLKGPGVTRLPDHHSICSWSGQATGKYAYVVSIQVTSVPTFLGRALLGQAKASELKAEKAKGGFGAYVTKNTRRGDYFEGVALWSEEQPNTEKGPCSSTLPGEAPEPGAGQIKLGQSGPGCAGQPGTEGDYATAWGSPRPNGEQMVVQFTVACQINLVSPLTLLKFERLIYSGGR